MAIIDPKNLLLQGMSGKIGNLVFKQMPNGKTHVSAVPRNTGKGNTEARHATRTTFRAGVLYAQEVLKDEGARAYYKRYGRKHRYEYHAAISDYKQAPEIKEVSFINKGNDLELRIVAVDDTRVCAVRCEYETPGGRKVVRAIEDELKDSWNAKIPVAALCGGRVRIVAVDRPGNEDEYVIELSNYLG
ncbi:hypothetical protein AB9P05_23165 [Roseivirga sp. BDSF3-8]|uniref:hypothetical protein n=1 Tax=Roseivirga sp. BDSF3-8 TaxID=3241598 RepID=UPI003531B340